MRSADGFSGVTWSRRKDAAGCTCDLPGSQKSIQYHIKAVYRIGKKFPLFITMSEKPLYSSSQDGEKASFAKAVAMLTVDPDTPVPTDNADSLIRLQLI